VQQVGRQEDAATEAHEQTEDALAAVALTLDPSCHMMGHNGEDERQQERQDEADKLCHPTFHFRE